jgi:hypothetical protein
VENFLRRDGDRCLVIVGEPGIGKSAVAARLRQVRPVHACHFCVWSEGGTLDPVAFARSLSHQLTAALPGLGDCLVEQLPASFKVRIDAGQIQTGANVYGVYIERLETTSADDAFQRLVREPLASWAKGRPPSDRVVLLVDGLDEARRLDHRPNIVDLIDKAGDLPGQVRWVLTSRPGPHLAGLRGSRLLLLDRLKENLDDARKRVEAVLAEPSVSGALEAGGADTDALANELVARSGGNFLYLRHVLNDLRKAAAAGGPLPAQERPPADLDDIYARFLDRLAAQKREEDWQRIYRPVLGALAVAQEALDFDHLARLSGVRPQEVHDAARDVSEFLDVVGDSATAYRLYHASFADFLTDRNRNPAFWIDPEAAHACVVEHYRQTFQGRWAACDHYGLRHLSHHLVAHLLDPGPERGQGTPGAVRPGLTPQVVEDLKDLVSGGFLDAKASQLGNAEAASEARRIAQLLVDAGDGYWDALVLAARKYCDLAERLRGGVEYLEKWVRNGQGERVLAVVDTEPDALCRGVLLLGLAPFFAEKGDSSQAEKLYRQAVPLVAPHLGTAITTSHWLGLVTKVLAQALLLKEPSWIHQPAANRSPRPEAPRQAFSLAAASPRATFPLFYYLLGYLRSRGVVFVMGCFVWGFIFFNLGSYLPLLSWVGTLLGILFFLSLMFLGLGVSFPLGLSGPMTRALAGLARGIAAAPPAEQRKALFRAVQFHCYHFGFADQNLVPWTDEPCAIIRGGFSALQSNTADIAQLVLLARAAGDAVCDTVIAELDNLKHDELERVFETVGKYRYWRKTEWPTLRLLVSPARPSSSPKVLLEFLRQISRTWVDESPAEDAAKAAGLLQLAPAPFLGRALLASCARRTTDAKPWHLQLAEGLKISAARAGMDFFARSVPLSRVEWFTVLIIFWPVAVVWVLIWPLLELSRFVFTVLLVTLLSLLRTHDPCGFSLRSWDGDIEKWRGEVNHALGPFEGWMLRRCYIGEGFVRHLRGVLVAQALLGEEEVPTEGVSPRSLLPVTRALLRSEKIGSVAEVLVRVMGNREWLDAAAQDLKPSPGRRRTKAAGAPTPLVSRASVASPKKIPQARHREQLFAVLPMRSAWLSFLLVVALGEFATSIALVLVLCTSALPFQDGLWRRGALEALGVCFYIALMRHLPSFSPVQALRARLTPGPLTPAREFGYRLIVGAVPFLLGSYFYTHPEQFGLFDCRDLFFLLAGLVLTNLLAPTVIAQWRGAGLLYPTPVQLRVARARSVLLLLGGSILCGFLLHLLIRVTSNG